MNSCFEADFIHNPVPGIGHSHAAQLLVCKSGKILCTWYGYPEEETQGGRVFVCEKDNTVSPWRKGKDVLTNCKSSLGNSVLCQDESGKIWLFYVTLPHGWWDTAILNAVCSEDDGVTWNEPRMISQIPGMMVRHGATLTDNGSLLLPAYDESKPETVILRLDTPYTQWREVKRFQGYALIQAVLVKPEPKTHVLLFRPTEDPRQIWRSASSNDGLSWSDPVRTNVPNPLSGLAAFCMGSKIALVNHPSDKNRYPLSIRISENQGVSWSDDIMLDQAQLEISYPSFVSDNEGWIHGVYTFNRRMIKYVRFNEQWIKEQSL